MQDAISAGLELEKQRKLQKRKEAEQKKSEESDSKKPKIRLLLVLLLLLLLYILLLLLQAFFFSIFCCFLGCIASRPPCGPVTVAACPALTKSNFSAFFHVNMYSILDILHFVNII